MSFLVSKELEGKITEADLYKEGLTENTIIKSDDSIIAVIDDKFFNVVSIDFNPFYEDGHYTKVLKIEVPKQTDLLRTIVRLNKYTTCVVCLSDDQNDTMFTSSDDEFTLSSIDKSLTGNSYVATIVIRRK